MPLLVLVVVLVVVVDLGDSSAPKESTTRTTRTTTTKGEDGGPHNWGPDLRSEEAATGAWGRPVRAPAWGEGTQGSLPPIGGQSPWAIPCRTFGAPNRGRKAKKGNRTSRSFHGTTCLCREFYNHPILQTDKLPKV